MGHELSDGVGEFGRFENLDRGDECLDEALTALLGRYRSAEIDAAYAAAYEAHPIDGEDDWDDLASFRRAASAT